MTEQRQDHMPLSDGQGRGAAGQSLVSVITPSYNQGHFIRETIESVLGQDYPYVEHIVVDGGSTDGTVEILREYGQRYPQRFRWVSEPDKGQSDAFNKGLALAHGPYVGWQNSDDLYTPGALRLLAGALEAHPDAAVACGGCAVLDEGGHIIARRSVRPLAVASAVHEISLFNQSALFRRSVLRDLGGLRVDLHFYMDHELWIRMAVRRLQAVCLPQVLGVFREHATSKTSTRDLSAYHQRRAVLQDVLVAREALSLDEQRQVTESLSFTYLVLAIGALLDGQDASCAEHLGYAQRLAPMMARDVLVVANAFIGAVFPLRGPLGRRLAAMIAVMSGQPGLGDAYRRAVLGRYYALLALEAGRQGQRRLMVAYTLQALRQDHSWVGQRREIPTRLAQYSVGVTMTRWLTATLRPLRRRILK